MQEKATVSIQLEDQTLAEELATSLRLLEGVDSQILTGGKSAPDIGTILTQVVGAGGLANLIDTLFTWLKKDRSRSLKLQIGENVIEASDLTSQEQHDLIDWFQKQTSIKLALH